MSFVQLAVEFNSCKITSNASCECSCKGSCEPGLLLSPASFTSGTEQSRKAASASSGRLHYVFDMMVMLLFRTLCKFCNHSVKEGLFAPGLHHSDKHSHSMKCKQYHIGRIDCLLLFAEYRSICLC